jgi:signal transduction histidine kinase
LEKPNKQQLHTEIIYKAESLIEDAITSVREIANKLCPVLLNNCGLICAVQSLINKVNKTSEIHFTLETNVDRRLNFNIEVSLYRAATEFINNAIKYSQSQNVVLKLYANENQVEFIYRDDGKGFDVEECLCVKEGSGLFNIKNRIQSHGGKMEIFSKPGLGVDYKIVLPV